MEGALVYFGYGFWCALGALGAILFIFLIGVIIASIGVMIKPSK